MLQGFQNLCSDIFVFLAHALLSSIDQVRIQDSEEEVGWIISKDSLQNLDNAAFFTLITCKQFLSWWLAAIPATGSSAFWANQQLLP